MQSTRPKRVDLDGKRFWLIDGKLLPVIAGGDGPDDGSDPTNGGNTAKKPKSFTQEDVDRMIQDRLAQERRQHGDIDALKAKAAELDQLKAADLTEVDRLKAENATLKEELNKANDGLKQSKIDASLAAIAAETVDPELVIELCRAQVTVGDDGQVTGAKEAVEALLEKRAYLRKAAGDPAAEQKVESTQKPSGSGDGGPRKPAQAPDLASLDMDAYIKATAKAS